MWFEFLAQKLGSICMLLINQGKIIHLQDVTQNLRTRILPILYNVPHEKKTTSFLIEKKNRLTFVLKR